MMKLADFQAVLFDMDGTLYREDHVLPGVAETLAYLREKRITTRFVTNNSANSHAELAARLERRGVTVDLSTIYTSCDAMIAWIETHFAQATPRVFNFAGTALAEDLAGRAAFVERTTDPCDVVAVGTHFRENNQGFDLERAIVGLNLLLQGAHLVVGSNDRVFPVAGGISEFGSGSWGRLFAYAANLPRSRVHYVGKPDAAFFTPLCRRLHLDPARCLLIGDNLESDIQGGINAGMKTALVLTGVATRRHVEESTIRPDAVFAGLPELLAGMG